MIAMAVIAGRGREVVLFIQGLRMYARFIFVELVVSDPIRGHMFGIRMTFRTRLGYVQRINGRLRVTGRANAMHSVATDTSCDVLVSSLQARPMNAGEIFLNLIDAQ